MRHLKFLSFCDECLSKSMLKSPVRTSLDLAMSRGDRGLSSSVMESGKIRDGGQVP